MKLKFLSLLILTCLTFNNYGQNKLEKAKESLRKQSSNSSSNNSNNNQNNDSENNRSLFGNTFGELFLEIGIRLTYGILVEFNEERNNDMHYASFTKYPFMNSNYGNYAYNLDDIQTKTRLDIATSMIIENRNLYGNNFNANYKFAKRFDVEFGALHLFEKTDLNKFDNFNLYSLLFNYHRVRAKKLDLWFGVGAMYVGNNVKEIGFGYNVGAELFIKKPISLLVTHKGTTINQQSVNKSRFLLKYYRKNFHIATGYERYQIGVSEINGFSIGVGASF